jgi:hypothetical protein
MSDKFLAKALTESSSMRAANKAVRVASALRRIRLGVCPTEAARLERVKYEYVRDALGIAFGKPRLANVGDDATGGEGGREPDADCGCAAPAGCVG